jgi:hypothetical protein
MIPNQQNQNPADILAQMAMQAQREANTPKVPILGQKPQIYPTLQITIMPVREGVVPFEAGMGLASPGGTPNQAFFEHVAPPDCLDYMAWFNSQKANQDATIMYWITRAMGCMVVMAQAVDPTFHLGNPKCRQRIHALQPKSVPLTPEQIEEQKRELDLVEAAKAQFLKDNPTFDPQILERRDEGALLAEMKENIEKKGGGDMHFSEDGERRGGGVIPPGEFKPRNSKVLNPNIEVVDARMLEGK